MMTKSIHLRQAGRIKATAADAASYLLENFADKSVVRRQLIDANQLQKLALTLGRPNLNGTDVSENAPVAGTPVPPGYHLAYFTPNGTEGDLGADGTDRTFNASAPFTRRMWAGGKMQWAEPSSGAFLRVGDEVEERTRLLSAVPKKSRSAGEMVLVEVEKEFWGPKGLALTDRRSWVFRPEIDLNAVKEPPKRLENVGRGPSSVKDLATKSEDHPGLVVHGPLNLINLLNYWRDIHGNGEGPKDIKYRAMSPLYAGETYNIRTDGVQDAEGGKVWDVLVEKNGTVCMKSEISA
ncbi:uncharacterized protein NECHADRAFT_93232 [Fusarium vanettenii 77-13-4]|uniref:Uncharacterized protein n=1 Tax=Fusarium vanettenii (strain ATCC MYA-4622 / CBS 123669 / FGSC 9596 / NRRL 45880 / 77-13-4) TaxID=660122 RepID=C7Z0K6_FUSV7|nr:uncharacterized protein NECHADRAFT_93232 [Fusarium vanettenii 77-13-4]EEU42220.1 hypothetical protein NECHADRAFT_93232 [Fusarium vanettenii 77-13-4]